MCRHKNIMAILSWKYSYNCIKYLNYFSKPEMRIKRQTCISSTVLPWYVPRCNMITRTVSMIVSLIYYKTRRFSVMFFCWLLFLNEIKQIKWFVEINDASVWMNDSPHGKKNTFNRKTKRRLMWISSYFTLKQIQTLLMKRKREKERKKELVVSSATTFRSGNTDDKRPKSGFLTAVFTPSCSKHD